MSYAVERPPEAVYPCRFDGVIIGDYFKHLHVVRVNPECDFIFFGPGVIYVGVECSEFIEGLY